ncbi:MAG: hypothetical protein HW411_1413, partial [Gammaproteobacteria bacterium]|nr:hypothetical protein [Gammaproteobacteria bacterium]
QGLFPTILLHFLHPWRSDAGGTTPGKDDHMDVEGRIMSGTIIEELESRREQRPRERREHVVERRVISN